MWMFNTLIVKIDNIIYSKNEQETPSYFGEQFNTENQNEPIINIILRMVNE